VTCRNHAAPHYAVFCSPAPRSKCVETEAARCQTLGFHLTYWLHSQTLSATWHWWHVHGVSWLASAPGFSWQFIITFYTSGDGWYRTQYWKDQTLEQMKLSLALGGIIWSDEAVQRSVKWLTHLCCRLMSNSMDLLYYEITLTCNIQTVEMRIKIRNQCSLSDKFSPVQRYVHNGLVCVTNDYTGWLQITGDT
jgi:hypothetical protein